MKTTKKLVAKIATVILAGMMVMALASCGGGAASLAGKTFKGEKGGVWPEVAEATYTFTSETAGTLHYYVYKENKGKVEKVYYDLDIPFTYEVVNTQSTGDGSLAKAFPYSYSLSYDEASLNKVDGNKAERGWLPNFLTYNAKEYKKAKEVQELKGCKDNDAHYDFDGIRSIELVK